jgi:hypothetical protein
LGVRNDPEKDTVEVNYVLGYPSLAAFKRPDHSTAIYRRFDRLSARNFLYLQAEISTLEKKQDELDKPDWNKKLETGAHHLPEQRVAATVRPRKDRKL